MNRLHVLEYTVVAIAAFLLGCTVRMDWDLLRRTLGLLLDY